jgi:hypothetical protein
MAKVPEVTKPNAHAVKIPDFLQEASKQYEGKGVSTLAEDNIVPLVRILQALSPACNKRSPDYVPGAEPGHVLLKNASNPVINGEEGFIFQPCYFSKGWTEWVPRDNGGGFAGMHAELPGTAKELTDAKTGRKSYAMPNGNELVEQRSHVGFVIMPDGQALPYVIPFTSSGHTISRGWMGKMGAKMLPNGGKAPSWACLYQLTTKERSNAAGTWFIFSIEDAGWVSDVTAFNRGAALYESFAAGDKTIEAPENPDDGKRSEEDAAM